MRWEVATWGWCGSDPPLKLMNQVETFQELEARELAKMRMAHWCHVAHQYQHSMEWKILFLLFPTTMLFFYLLVLFFHFFETGSHYPLQVSLENNDPPASASGIVDMSHHTTRVTF